MTQGTTQIRDEHCEKDTEEKKERMQSKRNLGSKIRFIRDVILHIRERQKKIGKSSCAGYVGI